MTNQSPDHNGYEGGQLLANLLLFARLLRQLSIPISSYQVHNLAEALNYIDITSEADFYNSARSFLLHDISKKEQFNLAFDLFWSSYIRVVLEFPSDQRRGRIQKASEEDIVASSQKNGIAHLEITSELSFDHEEPQESDIQVRPVYSANEVLRYKDFSQFNAEEFEQAKKLIRNMSWFFKPKRSRRKIPSTNKTNFLDFRRSFRTNVNYGGEMIDLQWKRKKYKSRQIIVLCDISGSMERYTQIFLYFLYAMIQESKRIETFVFGTRLTRLTLLLRKHKPEQILDDLSSFALDWSGGTRIGESLKDFNFHWARRVRCPGSIVIIISDGWDRGDHVLLEREIGRLSRTAYRLMWLNPLAGSEVYQPLVKGIQTVLPYLTDFHPLSNLNNLESLTRGIVDSI
jgi:uncharacterized protein with von Willebrand factor type A (vWA) domain